VAERYFTAFENPCPESRGYAPFRGEKGTTWEGGVRVPMLVKWPGHMPAGRELNGIQSHEDLYVTLAAAAGLPDLKEKLLTGYKMGDMTYKAHLDTTTSTAGPARLRSRRAGNFSTPTKPT